MPHTCSEPRECFGRHVTQVERDSMRREMIGLAVVLMAWTVSGAQTFVLHGLTNVTIGNAIYGAHPYGIVFQNLSSNGTDGVSIHLGEADSGIFVYPSTEENPYSGDFMAGEVYGNVNGETNRLICRMRAHEEADGVHPVEIDFSPVGATAFTYIGYDRELLVGISTGQVGNIVVGGNWFEPLSPRVNPFWRMPDGSIGALIEFLNFDAFSPYDSEAANVSIPGFASGRVERLFIRAEGVTNVVDFASRLDVFGGGGLEWFNIYDARLAAFGRAHKALPETLLQARSGKLTLAGTNDTPGVAIELQRAGRFEATLESIEFRTNSALVLTGIGRGSTNSGEPLGEARIARAGDVLSLSAHLDVGGATNVQVVVYQGGSEVGRATGTNATVPASTRLIGAGLQARTAAALPQMAWRFEQSVSVVLPDETSVQGDDVRFLAGSDARFVFLETMVLQASGLPSFTIAAESEQSAERPTLVIQRWTYDLELSWEDPNRAYLVETTENMASPFYHLQQTPSYEGNVARLLVADYTEIWGEAKFYRLSTDPRPGPVPEW